MILAVRDAKKLDLYTKKEAKDTNKWGEMWGERWEQLWLESYNLI